VASTSLRPSGVRRFTGYNFDAIALRYELGFIPAAIDGKRHELRVELTKAATKKHKEFA